MPRPAAPVRVRAARDVPARGCARSVLKRALDSSLYRGVAVGSGGGSSSPRRSRPTTSRRPGVPRERIVVRGNGFPDPRRCRRAPAAPQRSSAIPDGAPVVLYVGRIAAGKGIEHLSRRRAGCETAHLVLAGPGRPPRHDGLVRAAQDAPRRAAACTSCRPTASRRSALYRQADVFVLAVRGRQLRHRRRRGRRGRDTRRRHRPRGIAGFFGEGEALVVAGRPARRSSTPIRQRARRRRELRAAACSRRRRRRAQANVVGSRRRAAGRDLPRGGLAHGREKLSTDGS